MTTCASCHGPIPAGKRPDAKYCGPPCASVARNRAARDRGYVKAGTTPARNAEITLRRGGRLTPPRRSPFRVLCRTCEGCHETLSTPADLILKTSGPLPRCPRCAVAATGRSYKRRMTVDDHYRALERRRSDRAKRRINDQLADAARNHGQEWTGPELEILARPTTNREAALALGRTYYAVKHMRRKLETDPRKIALAGIAS